MNARMKYPSREWLLPPGRLVRGSLTDKQTKDHKGQPLQPEDHYLWFAVAIPKTDERLGTVWGELWQHVLSSYSAVAGSQAVLAQIQQGLAAPSFAWKIDDGDADPKWAARQGCPGNMIFQFKTLFEITTFDGANRQIDPKAFKLGDHIDVYFSAQINGETDPRVAGIYLNPRGVRWLAEGERIVTGPDAQTMFGAPVNAGYTGHSMAQSAPPSSVMTPQTPGLAGLAPGLTATAPAPLAPPAPVETAQQQAARLGVPYHAGYRLDEASWAYVPDVPAAPAGNAVSAQAVAAPAPSLGAPSVVPGTPAPAYPGNPYGPGNPPPVQPVQGFSTGKPQAPRFG